MDNVNYEGLYGTPSQNVFDVINTRSNIADPRDGSGGRKFVYNSFPFNKAIDSSDMPYIIVEDASIDPSTNRRADGKTEKMYWTQTITVRTVKDGSGGNRTDAGITDMRNIINSLLKTFKSETIKQSFRAVNMYDMKIVVIDSDQLLVDQEEVFETVLELSYNTHITVSE